MNYLIFLISIFSLLYTSSYVKYSLGRNNIAAAGALLMELASIISLIYLLFFRFK